ncbi:hypothetical protein CDAR_308471 [Caerostris darwini]|uniref:Uncharacterized protein n=1 Tax=Caerostris darwini TaxID=1538125 RepID=A0AAV4TXS7_9ARAC|nr:hypothetical protein CDAR_308471 [Caerostris darwini]
MGEWLAFSTFGIKTSALEEAEPTPPKEAAPTPEQVFASIPKHALAMAIQSRRSLDQLEERLSQADPSSESAANLKGHLPFLTDNYKSNLRVIPLIPIH